MRDVVGRIAQFKTEVPTGGTIEERLARVAIAVLIGYWTTKEWR